MAYVPWEGASMEKQIAAFEAADATSTDYGRKRGGYVRLARVTGSEKPYVIAARRMEDGNVQFTCSCPNWIYRRQSSGTLCKHQESLLTGGDNHRGHNRVWPYKAGEAWTAALGKKVQKKVRTEVELESEYLHAAQ